MTRPLGPPRRLRTLGVALLLGVACQGRSSAPSVPPACPTPASKTVVAQPVVELLSARLAAGHDLLIGEHHGQVAELDFLVEVVAAQERPVVVAMELLPARAQARLDALVSAERFSSADWLAVVGDRYWPAPLHVTEYVRVAEAVWSLRRKGVEARLVGLAPDCRLGTQADARAAMDCFRRRDESMLRALRALRMQHPDTPMIVSAGWRHLSAVRLPSAPKVLGESWPAHWPATRVLLTAPERAAATGWVPTCGAGPTALAASRAAPVAFDLAGKDARIFTLSQCVDLPSADARPLSAAFDLLVALPPGSAPTAMDAEAFARVEDGDRAAWVRTHTELMGQVDAPDSPEAWARWAAEDVAALSAQLKPAEGCPIELP